MLPNTSRLSLNTHRDAPVDASFPEEKVVTVAEALQRRAEALQRRIDNAKQMYRDEFLKTRNAGKAINAFSNEFPLEERIEFGKDLAKQAWTLFSRHPGMDGIMDAVDPERKISDGWGSSAEDMQEWNDLFVRGGAVPSGWQRNPYSGEQWQTIVRLTPLAFSYTKATPTVFALKATLFMDFKRQYDKKVEAYFATNDAAEQRQLQVVFFDMVPRSFAIPGVEGYLDDYTLADSIKPMLKQAYDNGLLQTPTGHFRVESNREFEGRIPRRRVWQ
jgi:hypothetical protein